MMPLYAYIHEVCGKPAFLLTEKPTSGSLAKSDTILHLDGSPYKRQEKKVCESCGLMTNLQSKNVTEYKVQYD